MTQFGNWMWHMREYKWKTNCHNFGTLYPFMSITDVCAACSKCSSFQGLTDFWRWAEPGNRARSLWAAVADSKILPSAFDPHILVKVSFHFVLDLGSGHFPGGFTFRLRLNPFAAHLGHVPSLLQRPWSHYPDSNSTWSVPIRKFMGRIMIWTAIHFTLFRSDLL